MVFFSCNACGDTIKKNQVEKHMFRCRQCNVLSCIDCCKDFYGNEYEKHMTCISEEQKYSGKLYKPKANADKGAKRQEEWVTVLRESVETSNVKPALRQVMQKLATFNNIPRKQQKFENFVRQCAQISDAKLIKEAWNIVSKAFEASKKPLCEQEKVSIGEENHSEQAKKLVGDKKEAKKLSKRERKEERQKQARVEKKDPRELLPITKSHPLEDEKLRCKRKRKREANGGEAAECFNGHDSDKPPKLDSIKSCKRRKKDKDENMETEEAGNNQEVEAPTLKKPRQVKCVDITSEKFKWSEIVKLLLEAADEHELSLKRLNKKIVAEYTSRSYSKPVTKEKLEAKLMKRIQKNPEFKLHKDRVKLVA